MVRRSVTLRSRALSLLVLALFAMAALTAALGGVVALLLAPAALAFLLLVHGIAPGEKLIERLRERRLGRRPRAARSLVQRRLELVVRRTGRELAAALAMRPPPVPAPLHR